MCGTESRKELPLASSAAGCSCNGVETASVDLVPDGRSRLVISGSAPAAARVAVTSAGYSLIPR